MTKIIAILSIATAALWALPVAATPVSASPDSELCGGHGNAPTAFKTKPAVGTKAKCPVSGNVFTVKADTQWSKYKNHFYGFCCGGCKPKFDANPAKYAGG